MTPKVLLVNVCYDFPVITEGVFSGINKIWQPIELAYAAALLKREGIEARALDSNALRIRPEDTGVHSLGYDFVFVSSSSYDRWECPHLDLGPTSETCRSIRAANPAAKIFLLGSHAAVRPKQMLELTLADAAVMGEPEFAVRDIAIAKDWKSVAGLSFLDGGRLIMTPARKPFDLNDLPLPDFSQFPMQKYSFDMLGGDFAVLEASRGCPFRCVYCLKVMFGPYRKKSLENLKREIKYCVGEFGVKRINFLDLEFTVNRPLVEGMCEWLIKEGLGLTWSCQTRLDSVDEALLSKMKQAGCKVIMFGVESGNPNVLQSIGKNIRIEDFKNGIKATKSSGIESVCFFMFGFPGESWENREETVKLALELDPDYASFFLCRPYPGTECHSRVADRSLGLFPLGVGTDQELLLLKDFCDKAFGRFYYRPNVIFRRIRRGGFGLLFNQMRLFLHKRGWINA